MLKEIFNLFFPILCLCCGRPLNRYEELLCGKCRFGLPYTHYDTFEGNPIEQMYWGRANVRKAFSLLFFQKGGNVQKLIHAMKYNNHPEVGVFLGKLACKGGEKFFSDIDYVFPLPLHAEKLKLRGYNQSEMIAQGLTSASNMIISTDLIRTKYAETQTHKERYMRYENTKDSFELRNGKIYEGKKLLLVDDVLTTGATTIACINAIEKRVANADVSVFTLAFAVS